MDRVELWVYQKAPLCVYKTHAAIIVFPDRRCGHALIIEASTERKLAGYDEVASVVDVPTAGMVVVEFTLSASRTGEAMGEAVDFRKLRVNRESTRFVNVAPVALPHLLFESVVKDFTVVHEGAPTDANCSETL